MRTPTRLRYRDRLLSMLFLLSACGRDTAADEAERLAASIRSKLADRRSLTEMLAYLNEHNFACREFSERQSVRGLPSFLCQKTIKGDVWRGGPLHRITVGIDADAAGEIVSSDVIIGWGGVRGL